MAWTNPLSGYITSGFNMGRRHPVLGITQAHRGTDIAPRAGHRHIGAIQSGVVVGVTTGRRRGTRRKNTFYTSQGTFWFGTGNAVLMRHAGGVHSYYGHLQAPFVRKGQTIPGGQAIGSVGATGVVTGVHLHLEILVGGRWNHVNPMSFMRARGVQLGSGRTSISTGPVIPITSYPSVQMKATPIVFKFDFTTPSLRG